MKTLSILEARRMAATGVKFDGIDLAKVKPKKPSQLSQLFRQLIAVIESLSNAPAPVVHVAAPSVNVASPPVNVEHKLHVWNFEIKRDENGRISSVKATPYGTQS